MNLWENLSLPSKILFLLSSISSIILILFGLSIGFWKKSGLGYFVMVYALIIGMVGIGISAFLAWVVNEFYDMHEIYGWIAFSIILLFPMLVGITQTFKLR